MFARPGNPLMLFDCVRSISPPRMLTSPSARRTSCSIFFVLITGWLIPPMLCVPVTEETSIDSFRLISWSGWILGVTSTITPTSRY